MFTSPVAAAEQPMLCTSDAMIVFDASGSMVGNGLTSESRIFLGVGGNIEAAILLGHEHQVFDAPP